MILLGLTGGIGMGKSTVAKMFQEYGYFVFDADYYVHELYGWVPRRYVADYATRLSFVEHFNRIFPGYRFYDGTEKIDREKLKRAIELNPEMLKHLSIFFEPWIESALRIIYIQANNCNSNLLLDIPLLFDGKLVEYIHSGYGENFKTVVVSCPDDIQRKRVLERPGMTQEQLDVILASQLPNSERAARADYIIDTSGDLDDVKSQVLQLCTLLKLSNDTSV
jgi:dephospho-CoA kinase